MVFLEALRLLFTDGRLRVLCVRPLVWSLVLYAGMWGLAWFGLSWLVVHWTDAEGVLAVVLRLATGVLALVAATWLAGYLFVALLCVVSAFLWETISRHVERGKQPSLEPLRAAALARDAVARLGVVVVISVILLVATIVTGGSFLPMFLGAGFLGLLDFTAPAFLLRGITLGRQFALLPVLRWNAVGLAVCVGVLTLFPFFAAAFAPLMVVVGTLAVSRIPEEQLR